MELFQQKTPEKVQNHVESCFQLNKR